MSDVFDQVSPEPQSDVFDQAAADLKPVTLSSPGESITFANGMTPADLESVNQIRSLGARIKARRAAEGSADLQARAEIGTRGLTDPDEIHAVTNKYRQQYGLDPVLSPKEIEAARQQNLRQATVTNEQQAADLGGVSAQPGFIANTGRGFTSAFGGTGGGLIDAASLATRLVGADGATAALQRAAARTRGYGPATETGSQAVSAGLGQTIAGTAQALAGPAGTATQVTEAGLRGLDEGEAQVRLGNATTGQEVTNALTQAGLAYGANKLAQANVTGKLLDAVAPTAERTLGQVAARQLARTGIESAVGAGNQLASNAATKFSGVDADRDLTEGLGTAAAIGGGVGLVGGALHDAAHPAVKGDIFDKVAGNTPPADDIEAALANPHFTDAEGNPVDFKPKPETHNAERVETPEKLAAKKAAHAKAVEDLGGTIEAGPSEADQDTIDRMQKALAAPEETPQRRAGERDFTPAEDRELIRKVVEDPNAFGRRRMDWAQMSVEGKTLLQKLRENQIAKEQAEREAPQAAGPAPEAPAQPQRRQPAINDPSKTWSSNDMLSYIKSRNTGDLDEGATKELLGNKSYKLQEVPLDQIGEPRGKAGIKRPLVEQYSKQAAETSPPIVLGEDGRPIDGKHRLAAAQARGDTTIKAMVPVTSERTTAPDIAANTGKAPTPNPDIRQQAADYAKKAGIDYNPDTTYAKVDEARASKIANAYAAMEHDPSDPAVKRSYDAFKKETLAQYQHLKDEGVKFEYTDKNPYPDSKAMAKDIKDNGRLKVYTGGDMPEGHPLAEKVPGEDVSYNDVFRGVHDYFGHAKEGYGFGPRGEENAWRQHSQMYSPEARGAMTAETRGQNSWVNFGPHGEANRANPAQTVYAEQKAGLLPAEHQELDEKPSIYRNPRNQAGAMAIPTKEDLIGPGSIYHEEVKPKLEKSAGIWANLKEATRSLFPVESGGGHEPTELAARRRLSEQKNLQQRAQDAFQPAREAFDKMSKDDQLEFQRAMYDKAPQPTPELQTIADAMYKDTNEGRQLLVAAGKTAAQGWDTQKFNMLWKKDPKAAAALNEKINTPGKLGGRAGFLKAQTLEDFQEGLDKGLVPKYDNPVEQFLATKVERGRYLAGLNTAKDVAAEGSAIKVLHGAATPDGFVKASPAVTGLFRDVLSADPATSSVYIRQGAARILDNMTKPSFFAQGTFRGDVYKALQGVNNVMTQSLLGLSAFHLKKVTQENINLEMARALESGTAPELGRMNPIKSISSGKDLQDVMLGKKQNVPPEQQRLADLMIKSGFAAKPDEDYQTSIGYNFKKALNDGGVQGLIRAGVRALPALNEKIMQDGVFKYVQHTKLARGADQISDYIKANPNATDAEIQKYGAKVSDHLDNVLGLMNKDNLFWNRTARDLATLSTLSVGWNYGSARALAGGLMDLGKGLGSLASGKGLSAMDRKRISYIASTAALTALTSAAATYLATGHGPRTLQDYVHPDTGKKDRNGDPVRADTGFYTDDWFGFMTHPVDSATAKASPIVHLVGGLAQNQNQEGQHIIAKDDDWHTQALKVAKYLGQSMEPLAVKQLTDTIAQGGKTSLNEKLLPFVGVKNAPVRFSRSDAENEAYSLLSEHPRGQQSEAGAQVSHLADEVRQHDPDAIKDINAAQQGKQITFKDRAEIFKRAQEPQGLLGLVRRSEFDTHDLMKIWDKATPEEKRSIQWTMRKRIQSANIQPDERLHYMQTLNSDLQEAK